MSVYADSFVGKRMANGQPYDPDARTAASNDWNLGTRLSITLGSKTVTVIVTDRTAKRFSGNRVDASRRVWRTLTGNAKPGLRQVQVVKS